MTEIDLPYLKEDTRQGFSMCLLYNLFQHVNSMAFKTEYINAWYVLIFLALSYCSQPNLRMHQNELNEQKSVLFEHK